MLHKLTSFKQSVYHKIWPYFHPIRSLEWKQLKTTARSWGTAKVLSLGCGTGFFEDRLNRNYKDLKITGIDISFLTLKDATLHHQRESKISFCLANANELPFCNNSFDVVISICGFEHFHNPEKVLYEISRVLRPQGKLWLSVDAFDHPSIKAEIRGKYQLRHKVINFFPLENLSKLLKENGFGIEHHEYLIRSKGSAWVYHLNSRIKSCGWDVLEPILYLPLRFFMTLCDAVWGTKNRGYLLAVYAKLTNQ